MVTLSKLPSSEASVALDLPANSHWQLLSSDRYPELDHTDVDTDRFGSGSREADQPMRRRQQPITARNASRDSNFVHVMYSSRG
jgi:hypothetical protein